MRASLLAVAAILALTTAGSAVAGIQPSHGNHTATPNGGSPQGFTVDLSPNPAVMTWIDGREYEWVPAPPPAGNGYFQFGEPPDARYVTFNDSGGYEETGGFGTWV